MERAIETVGTGLANSVAFMADRGILVGVFALLWLALGAGLFWAQGSVDAVWQWIRSLPFAVQIVVWLLFLPVMAGSGSGRRRGPSWFALR